MKFKKSLTCAAMTDKIYVLNVMGHLISILFISQACQIWTYLQV